MVCTLPTVLRVHLSTSNLSSTTKTFTTALHNPKVNFQTTSYLDNEDIFCSFKKAIRNQFPGHISHSAHSYRINPNKFSSSRSSPPLIARETNKLSIHTSYLVQQDPHALQIHRQIHQIPDQLQFQPPTVIQPPHTPNINPHPR